MKLSAVIGRSSEVRNLFLIRRLRLQASIAQPSDNDPFYFSGGLNGGVKVSGGDNFAARGNENRHLLVLARQNFAITQSLFATNSKCYAN
jgi:hypothetical protein